MDQRVVHVAIRHLRNRIFLFPVRTRRWKASLRRGRSAESPERRRISASAITCDVARPRHTRARQAGCPLCRKPLVLRSIRSFSGCKCAPPRCRMRAALLPATTRLTLAWLRAPDVSTNLAFAPFAFPIPPALIPAPTCRNPYHAIHR